MAAAENHSYLPGPSPPVNYLKHPMTPETISYSFSRMGWWLSFSLEKTRSDVNIWCHFFRPTNDATGRKRKEGMEEKNELSCPKRRFVTSRRRAPPSGRRPVQDSSMIQVVPFSASFSFPLPPPPSCWEFINRQRFPRDTSTKLKTYKQTGIPRETAQGFSCVVLRFFDWISPRFAVAGKVSWQRFD